MTSIRFVGMSLPPAAWIKVNRLGTGVKWFNSSFNKWDLAPSADRTCCVTEQTADQFLSAYPIHRTPHETKGLTVFGR